EKERKERNKIIVTKQNEPKAEPVKTEDDNVIKTKIIKLNGPTVLGKINLPEEKKAHGEQGGNRKKRRKRISKENGKVTVERKPGDKAKGNVVVKKQVPGAPAGQNRGGDKKKRLLKKEVNEEDVQKRIKDTRARLTTKGKSKGSKHRRDKRAAYSE